jgi:mRNA interferase MazF
MTGYRRGDVVVVPFPFTDLTTSKQRPALVVSPDSLNLSTQDVMIAALTSHVTGGPGPFDLVVSGQELAAAGLMKPSVIKLGKLVTIHGGLIRKKIGALSPDRMAEVLTRLRGLFAS